MKVKDAKLGEKAAWGLILLAKLGTRIQDKLDMKIRPSEDDTKHLYKAAKEFIEGYEQDRLNEGDGKS